MARRWTVACLLGVLAALPAAAQFASEQNRREAVRHYRRGQELVAAERYPQAITEFQQAIAQDRLLTLAHHALGDTYMLLKQYASAIVAFSNTRAAFLTLHGLRERDRVAVERQREEELRELRDTIRRMQQNNSNRQFDLRITRLEQRIEDLLRQRTSNSEGFVSPPELSLALGSAYFRHGQLENAEREWKAAVAVNEELGEAHNNLAALYAMTGRKNDAEQAVAAAERARFRVNPQLKADIARMH